MIKPLLHFLFITLPVLMFSQSIGLNSISGETPEMSLPYHELGNNFQVVNPNQYLADFENEDCSQIYEGDYFSSILMMNTGNTMWMAANDINVEANNQFTIQSLEFEVITIEGLPTTFSVGFFRNSSGGGVGAALGSVQTEIVPVSITPNGTWGQSGYTIYKVVIELPNPQLLTATSTEDIKYWVGISGNPTTEESYFIYMASSLYEENSESASTWISDGSMWLEYVDTSGNGAEGIIKLSGICEPVQGCTEAPNGQFPSETFFPSCNGFVENITTSESGLSGQYSVVHVTNGTEYTFSSSEVSDFLTISDENGNTTLAVGTGSVSWTADFDGNVRFFTHLDATCNSDNESNRSRKIQCGVPICDEQKVNSNNIENGTPLGGLYQQGLALDIPVGEDNFMLYGIELNLIRTPANTDNITFNAQLYEENNSVPGNLLIDFSTSIYDSEYISTVIINETVYEVYRYKLQFQNPTELNSNSKFWLEIKTTGEIGELFWETSTAAILGKEMALRNIPTGFNWALVPNKELVYSLICDEFLDSEELNTFDFSYYPNPVKDILYINSNKKIEQIEIYNMIGQSQLNLVDHEDFNQIDLKSLKPGIYLFKIKLQTGQIETFKILKN